MWATFLPKGSKPKNLSIYIKRKTTEKGRLSNCGAISSWPMMKEPRTVKACGKLSGEMAKRNL